MSKWVGAPHPPPSLLSFKRKKTMTTFFGFAVADSMFPATATIKKEPFTFSKEEVESAVPILNSTHTATIAVLETQYKVKVAIPEKPPSVSLQPGDAVIVMGVRGLPRLTDRHEYTPEEIAGATFAFSKYIVLE